MSAFRVKLDANDLNYVAVPLNPTNSLTATNSSSGLVIVVVVVVVAVAVAVAAVTVINFGYSPV